MNDWINKQQDPISIFKDWFEKAQQQTSFEPTKMTLATVDSQGMPSARVVLLKHYDETGFCFFTNYESQKAQELLKQPKAALVFHWEKPFHRQVRVSGVVEKMTYEESNAYFQTRHRGSQIGAWASPQSREVSGREELVTKTKELEEKFLDQVIPCPKFWGGFRVRPLRLEFWQSQDHRLHNRIRFQRQNLDDKWAASFRAP